MREGVKEVAHVVNAGMCTWYEFACMIVRLPGMTTRELIPSNAYPAAPRRPTFFALTSFPFFRSLGHWAQNYLARLTRTSSPGEAHGMNRLVFFLAGRPASGRSEGKRRYQARVERQASAAVHSQNWRAAGNDQLCVRIVYVRRQGPMVDVDNLSKPILDALKGIVYDDDHQVVCLVVGICRSGTQLELTNLSDPEIAQLQDLLESEDDFVCVEVGIVRNLTLRIGSSTV